MSENVRIEQVYPPPRCSRPEAIRLDTVRRCRPDHVTSTLGLNEHGEPRERYRRTAKSDAAEVVTTQYPKWWTELDTKAVDTARLLAADAVQKVGNGHPGTAMSLAPLAYLLFQKVMRHDPTDPNWVGPRPVRAVQRALIAHPVHPAVPLRLRPGTRRPQVAADLGLADSGPPGARSHDRRRDHHRPARAGRRQRRRDGDGRPPRAWPVRPRRRTRRVAVRPPHLRHRRRRLPGGGHLRRGVLAWPGTSSWAT